MSAPDQIDLTPLETRIGHVFKDKTLLQEALTHPSLDAHRPENYKNYQRLEFLGDRVLGLVVAEMLLQHFPAESEGDIAKRHAALVQAKALHDVALALELGTYLSLSRGEHRSGGRYKMTVLADAAEALIGALYFDGGLAAAKVFVEKHWQQQMQSFELPPMDVKTRLQEWAQKRGDPLPEYTLLSRTGADHSPVFVMEVKVEGLPPARGTSNSKRDAQKAAAEALLQIIEEQTDKDTPTE